MLTGGYGDFIPSSLSRSICVTTCGLPLPRMRAHALAHQRAKEFVPAAQVRLHHIVVLAPALLVDDALRSASVSLIWASPFALDDGRWCASPVSHMIASTFSAVPLLSVAHRLPVFTSSAMMRGGDVCVGDGLRDRCPRFVEQAEQAAQNPVGGGFGVRRRLAIIVFVVIGQMAFSVTSRRASYSPRPSSADEALPV
jgi:hypothetical protein